MVSVVVLNIGKMDTGKAQYYLDSVAQGVEDYYLHAGEAPGTWRGAAAGELGLSGRVEAEPLLRVLAGVHPETGERLAAAQRSGERVPGFDLTFRVPKSVSLLHALGGPEVREQVRQAHEASVMAASGYLEREAGFGRRRVEGQIVDVPTSGFVAAAFQHRTSRAGDCQWPQKLPTGGHGNSPLVARSTLGLSTRMPRRRVSSRRRSCEPS